MADVPACFTLPPATASYTPKGTYTLLAGLNTYVVGPPTASTAIVYVYDIFGITPQSLQGADLLASQGVYVVQPDFFGGEKMRKEWMGSQDPEHIAQQAAFREGPANPQKTVPVLSEIIAALKSIGSIKKVGATGFCWGAKVCILNQDVDAIGLVHPSRLTAEDGEAVTVPVCLLPSSGEDPELMTAVKNAIWAKPFASSCVFKTFSDSVHGWAAARADLTDPAQRKTYEEAYAILSAFFGKVLV